MTRVTCFTLFAALALSAACSGGASDSSPSNPLPSAAAHADGADVPIATASTQAPTTGGTAPLGSRPPSETAAPATSASVTSAADPGVVASIRMPSAGISEKLALPYSQHDAVSAWARCSLTNSSGAALPATTGFSFVTGSMQSAGRVKRIELTATEEVKVPGIAKARGTLRTGEDETITGTITFNSDKVSGTFDMKDSSGAPVTGSFNCSANL